MSNERKTVAVDFDGVLHQWDGEWRGYHVIQGKPVAGAIEWLSRTIQHFDVMILSTRALTWRGRWAIRAWLREHGGNIYHESMGFIGIEDVRITAKKYPALVYLDDRAVRFDGSHWPTREDIHVARPWWKP